MTHTTQKGFTLIEMITVLGIFTIITTVVIFNYNKFRSDTILINMAYEVALSIREAQIYGVSVRNGGPGSYKDPYGIYLPTNSAEYFLFIDKSTPLDGKFSGTSCASTAGDTCAIPYTLQRNVKITDIKRVDTSGATVTCTMSENNVTGGLSVLFNRPNPEPVITGKTVGPMNQAEITIQAPEGTKRYVEIYTNGQIAVLSNKLCP